VDGIGAPVLDAPGVLALLTPFAGASAEAADLTAGFRAGADLRAAVFVDVVRVGIDLKNFHGSQAAN
jgi:hypothetical protein